MWNTQNRVRTCSLPSAVVVCPRLFRTSSAKAGVMDDCGGVRTVHGGHAGPHCLLNLVLDRVAEQHNGRVPVNTGSFIPLPSLASCLLQQFTRR